MSRSNLACNLQLAVGSDGVFVACNLQLAVGSDGVFAARKRITNT